METVLTAKNLTKHFGARKVLDSVSFDVFPGEIFGFLGPNGAGKTTAIKMILGFLEIEEGEVFICEKNVRNHFEESMSKVGGIVENPDMYKEFSGYDNLKMYCRAHSGVNHERIREVLQLVGMDLRARDKVKKYSLGMKQRLGLAMALLHKPKLLILDEPTNGLDPMGVKELRDILKHLAHEEGIAVLVSSHILSEMELMCDRVCIISNGKVLGTKPIGELLSVVKTETVFRFFTEKTDEAMVVFEQNQMLSFVKGVMQGQFFDYIGGSEEAAHVNMLLVSAGLPVNGFTELAVSLEDAFLNITGGGIRIE